MYSDLKYLFMPAISHLAANSQCRSKGSVSRPKVGAERALLRSNNNKHSSGLPHSEIPGSKPILGSPELIAEYHVLHRLLLPRHSPNALLALDLIQKKKDLTLPKSGSWNNHPFSWLKSILSRIPYVLPRRALLEDN